MTKTPRTLSIALAAVLALLVVPASALAEYLVPEGNSAVTQYTEGFPTAGGEKKTEGNKPVTAAKAIGAANAKKLEDHGPDGAAVAEVAAETAPAPVTDSSSASGSPTEPADSNGQAHEQRRVHDKQAKGKPAKQDSGQKSADKEEDAAVAPAPGGSGPGGSSGLSEVLGAATGSSSTGQLGLLLPLVILGALAWAFAFFWRQRKQADPAVAAKP